MLAAHVMMLWSVQVFVVHEICVNAIEAVDILEAVDVLEVVDVFEAVCVDVNEVFVVVTSAQEFANGS